MPAARVFDAAAVLLPHRVADPMHAIFDAPVLTPKFEQLDCVGPLWRKTRDGVLNLAGRCAVTLGRPLEAKDLCKPWPVSEQRNDTRAGLQMSRHQAAVFFAVRSGFGRVGLFLTLTGGGKMPAGNRRRLSLSVRVGCL